MSTIYTCECGLKTREPFLIGGRIYCAICAEQLSPSLVARKARQWADFGRAPRPRRTLWKDVDWD